MHPLPSPNVEQLSLCPSGHWGGIVSMILVGSAVAIYVFVVLSATLSALRWWSRARRAERSFREDAELAPGEVVVHGRVEYAPDEQAAVRVEIDQEGSEQESSGSWTTVWLERERRVEARPFYLRHASGKRIRVEPTRAVELVDDMDGVIRVDLTKRTRTAELVPGEEVFVHGRLGLDTDRRHGAGGPELVIRPSEFGRLLLSTEPLGDRFRRPMRKERSFALGASLALVVTCLFASPYLASLVAGRVGSAVVTELKVVVHSDDDGTSTCHRVEARLREVAAESIVQCVSEDDYAKLKVGMVVPARITESRAVGWSSAELGSEATASVAVQFALLLALFAGGFYLGRNRHRGWYAQQLNEAEPGRLAPS
jgi:hypothetical protein